MSRLNADLIARSPKFLNPIKQYELDLRGNKIETIENLGATQDKFDCLDLSDNQIQRVENFPLLKRIRTLFLSNNKINFVAPNLGESLPELETLALARNKITNLSDLDVLVDLPKLRFLSLQGNPVTRKENYRLYVIHLCPRLRSLDFSRIKLKERVASKKTIQSSCTTTKTQEEEDGRYRGICCLQKRKIRRRK